MTEFGSYFAKKSASKSEIAKKIGISKSRISELTLKPSTQLRVRELYLIALAIDADPGEVLEEVCKGLKMEKQ
jgi:DNA-binding Xre family transcriptional regulator